jgi:Virulence-associated protein E
MQECEPLCRDLQGEIIDAGGIATRPGEARDKTSFDRVCGDAEDDRDRRRRAFRRGRNEGVVECRDTATRRRTRSAISAGSRSNWLSSQWHSMVTSRYSTYPLSQRPLRNAAKARCDAAADQGLTNATVGAGCCALARNAHAAVPPIPAMNSRRRISTPSCHFGSLTAVGFHGKRINTGSPQKRLSNHLIGAHTQYEAFDFEPARENTFNACVQLCLEHSFDPIVGYFDALRWGGKARVDTWLCDYLGAENTAFNRMVGRLMLVAMVRRARKPGCKFDQIIVLEGAEGKLNSTALLVLAGSDENFSDQTILGLKDQEQQERLRGKWVYEIGDLAGIRKAEVESVKAFASRTHDRARPAFGRAQVELPRRCIICATTNDSTYLKSRTGNRRFWPIKIGTIDVEALKRDRDQLLAEASVIEARGEPLTLPKELWGDAAAAQDERLEHDPWIDKLADLQGIQVACADGKGKEERISTDEILSHRLVIPRRAPDGHRHQALELRDACARLGRPGQDPLRPRPKLAPAARLPASDPVLIARRRNREPLESPIGSASAWAGTRSRSSGPVKTAARSSSP